MPKIVATKEDWIDLGYRLFSEEGVSGVIVEKMAKTLKVNKSSFYWHFKTREYFINELTMFWVNNETLRIIDLTNSKKAVSQKFKTFIALVYKQDPYSDFLFFLKRYAKMEKKIQLVLDKIDNQRVGYANRLLLEMGCSKQEAKIKSTLLYKHFIGYHEIIRYKKQSINYQKEVKAELNLFIKY